MDFAFEEVVEITDIKITEQVIIGVDLGINNACVCSAMKSDGTVIGRQFLKLPREKDCLNHAVNIIKKAQQNEARKMPRLWARAKGLNQNVANLTAQFIIDVAKSYSANVIVFEHLDLSGKKRGTKIYHKYYIKRKGKCKGILRVYLPRLKSRASNALYGED